MDIASQTDQENRRLPTLRKEASQTWTQIVNKIKHRLRRHNLEWGHSDQELSHTTGDHLAQATGIAVDQTEKFPNQTVNRDQKPLSVIHNRDSKFSKAFKDTLGDNGVQANVLPKA